MRYLIVIFALTLPACGGASSFAKAMGNALLPSNQYDTFKRHAHEWASARAASLFVGNEPYVPMYINGEQNEVPETKLEQIKKAMNSLLGELTKFADDHRTDMKALRGKYDAILITLEDFEKTSVQMRDAINAEVANFKDVASDMADRSSYVHALCNELKIDTGSSNHCGETTVGAALLSASLKERRLKLVDYREWVASTMEAFSQIRDEIVEIGMSFEVDQRLRRARQSGCKRVTQLGENGIGESIISYEGREPDPNIAYDLGYLRVFSRSPQGILLRPDQSRFEYSTQIVFVETTKPFADGYLFEENEQLVCYIGLKTYSAVLGNNMTVYAFRPFAEDKNAYYFIQ
jgi:hypothetical protein